ncbi:MAG: glycosyltransferase [Thermoanaerobaculia bacterium]|nr:glycosyltransferase [Thermoanaerobaculia bacterium]
MTGTPAGGGGGRAGAGGGGGGGARPLPRRRGGGPAAAPHDSVPLAIAEALACGVPVVATAVGGIPEMLSFGRAGLLVDEGREDGLVSALREVIEHPEAARRRAVAGREQVDHYFDSERNTEILGEWIRESVQIPAARARAGTARASDPGSAATPRRRPESRGGEPGRGLRVVVVAQVPPGEKGDAGATTLYLESVASALRDGGSEVSLVVEGDDEALEDALARELGSGVDLIYESYLLGAAATSRWARRHRISHVVGVGAPEARRRYRYGSLENDPALEARDRELLENAALVVATSKGVADYAIERGADAGRTRIVHHGVDPGLFRPRSAGDPWRRRLVPGGKVAVGFHGAARPWHGFELVADSVGALLAKGAPVHLVVVGGEGCGPALSRLPRGACTRLEWQEREDLARCVAAFDVFALGSGPDGLVGGPPLRLLEAMACGVVPVVPRAGDLVDIVGHGREGWLYRPASQSSLEVGLSRLIEDDALRARLAVAARARALDLGWSRLTTALLEWALRHRRSGAPAVAE